MVVTPILLAVLGIADVTFSAFRDAAGRNPRIEKTAYYRRALRGGLRAGLAIITTCALVAGVVVALAGVDPERGATLVDDMVRAGTPMAAIYGGFAASVVVALLVWSVSASEMRTFMTVAVLGPMTLLRHVLIPVGLLTACVFAERWETRALALFAVLLVGSAEPVFGALRARRKGRLWPGDPETS